MKDFRTSAKQIEDMYNQLEAKERAKSYMSLKDGYKDKDLNLNIESPKKIVMKIKYTKLKRGKECKGLSIGSEYFVYQEDEDGVWVDNDINHSSWIPNNCFEIIELKDGIVERVINQFKQRSAVGITKYGVTLDRNDLSMLDWLNHAQQEAMDFCLYLEKLKFEIKKL